MEAENINKNINSMDTEEESPAAGRIPAPEPKTRHSLYRERRSKQIHLKVSASGVGRESLNQEEERNHLKKTLRLQATRLNATLTPEPDEVQSFFNTVDLLSTMSPVIDTMTSPLIDGRWVLLYTASSKKLKSGRDINGRDGEDGLAVALPFLQVASDTAYKFFYRYVPILAGSAVGAKGSSAGPVKTRGNFQVFDIKNSYVLNQSKLKAFGKDIQINVSGIIEVVKPRPGEPSILCKATFKNGEVVIGDGIAMSRIPIPIGWISPVGYVSTPYLDGDLRISKGDKGSIFIAVRGADTPNDI